jgi:hypothetical protein
VTVTDPVEDVEDGGGARVAMAIWDFPSVAPASQFFPFFLDNSGSVVLLQLMR